METICWQDTIRSSPEFQNLATKYCLTFHCDNPPLSIKEEDSNIKTALLEKIDEKCVHPLNEGINNFGLFGKSIESGYTGRTRFRGKLFYFMWWGLKNLRFVFLVVRSRRISDFIHIFSDPFIIIIVICSNFGTNLEPSSFVWENCFAILVSAIGLVLFAFLIGNMQVGNQFP